MSYGRLFEEQKIKLANIIAGLFEPRKGAKESTQAPEKNNAGVLK